MSMIEKVKQKGQKLRRQLQEPHDQFDLRTGMNRAFERMWQSLRHNPAGGRSWIVAWPAMDLTEDEHHITLRMDVPGMEAKDISVEVSGRVLAIKGTRQMESQNSRRGVRHHERIAGSFYRSVALPDYADVNNIKAKFDKGVLELQIGRIVGLGPKRVPISAAE
ncbi:MAG: Hsp20/alpha crystallin family protein [Phycisphaerales bacterium]|nr:Hsp20/alpha crystallin family protein [Phycisphaerales bacterium]